MTTSGCCFPAAGLTKRWTRKASWTGPQHPVGRRACSALDKPARRFLINGGDYAHDIVDRTLDLLDRLAEPDPDFGAVGLPSYMIEEAKNGTRGRAS